MNAPVRMPARTGAGRSREGVAALGRAAGSGQRARSLTGVLGAGRERWLKVAGVVLFFGVWELVPRLLHLNPFVLPPPTLISKSLIAEIRSGEVGEHLLVTAAEYFLSLALACVVGITVGVAAGRIRLLDSALEPFVWFLYATPLTAIYPLLILWVGLGFNSVLVIAFLLAVIPILINATVGVKNADRTWIQVGRSFTASPWQNLRKIIIPGAAPIILAGIRLAVGRSLTGVVIGEMFGADEGIGYRIAENAARIRVPEVFAYLLIVVAFGVVVTQAFGVLESRLLRHQPRNR